MSEDKEEEMIPATEQKSIHWNSKINVCRASTSANSVIISHKECKDRNASINSNMEELGEEDIDETEDWESDSSWPDIDIPGTWGTQALEKVPWSDHQKPYVKIRRYKDLVLDETEIKGILTDRTIAACSSYLDKNPVTGKYALCKVDLSKKHLVDISILGYHHYLQYINLSWNELAEVKALGQLPFLMYLDVSHNFLTKILDFKPPLNLTFVNYSFNSITKIDDLSDFWSVVHLDLSHNNISVIEGLNKLKYVRYLDLSFNLIECIENLSHMRLLNLNLSCNSIDKFEEGEDLGLKTLNDLICIDVSFNQLKTLKLFAGIPGIQALNVSSNDIDDLMEINYLHGLIYLTEVDFRNNPIHTMKYYMEVCVHAIKHLYILDADILDASKKVSLARHFNPNPWTETARKCAKIITLEQINDPILSPAVIPADHSVPPIIIVVGPPGSAKGSLTRSFCTKYKRFTVLGVSHTTRNKTKHDVDGTTYNFVDTSTFKSLKCNGKFLEVSQCFGNWFGLSTTEIEKVVQQPLVLVLHMDLTGALMLRSRGYKCRMVLAMPSTTDVHKDMIAEKYYSWKYETSYVNTMEIENNPDKAQKFFEENYELLQSSITSMAVNVLDSMIDTTVKVSESEHSSLSQISSGYQDLNKTSSVFASSGKLSDSKTTSLSSRDRLSSSRTSGILKANLSRSKTDNELLRSSVTFRGDNKVGQSIQHSSLQRSGEACNRSVTFSYVEQRQIAKDSCTLPQYSVSATIVQTPNDNEEEARDQSSIINKEEDDDNCVLSVLSDSTLTTAIKNENLYDFKTRHAQRTALKTVIKDVIETREVYMEFHYANPGIFCEVIFTDYPNEANAKLKALLKDCIQRQPTVGNHVTYEKDSIYQTMVATRLKSLHDDIKRYMIVSEEVKEQTKAGLCTQDNKTEIVRTLNRKREESLRYELPKEEARSSIKSEDEVSGAVEGTAFREDCNATD